MGLFDTIKNTVSATVDPDASSIPGKFPFAKGSPARPGAPAAAGIAEVTSIGSADVAASIPASTAKRVLFVDADPISRQRFERESESMRRRWAFTFVSSSSTALQRLAEGGGFDAVIADFEMAGMNGLDLLNEVAKLYPKILRFIRCEGGDRAQFKCSTGPAPQSLARDGDAALLEATLERAFLLESWMAGCLKQLVLRIRQLPSLPTLFTQVRTELQKADGSIEIVAEAIAKDPVMTAKVLQVANSPHLGLAYEIISPIEAVRFLGTERTKSLILLAKVFSQFDKAKCAGFSIDAVWLHSMAVGSIARTIMLDRTRDTKLADLAFTAGLLHDVGKLLLAANLPEEYGQIIAQAERRKITVREVEKEALGATHAELAACLLGLWGLPLSILQAIAWHHSPNEAGEPVFSVLTAVHIANVLDYERKGVSAGKQGSQFDESYLHALKLPDRLNRWRELCNIATKSNGVVVAEKSSRER